MSLIDDLRKKRVAGPTARTFDLKAWLQLGATGPSFDEMLVIATGVLLHDSLTQLRNRLRYVGRDDVANGQKRRQLIAISNRDGLLAHLAQHEQVAALPRYGGLIAAHEAAAITIELPTGRFTPDAVGETSVDAAGRLLQMCMKGDRPGASTEFPERPDDDLLRDFVIGNAYLVLEDLWSDVVWNDLKFRQGKPMSFIPGDENEERARAIGRYRHDINSMQATHIHAGRIKRHLELGTISWKRPHRVVGARQAANELELYPADLDVLEVAELLATLEVAVPDYYEPLLHQRSELFPSLTLMRVLEAHMALRRLARDLSEVPLAQLSAERARADAKLASAADLAPVISISALIETIACALGITAVEADDLVRFFTYGAIPDHSEFKLPPDLWSAPLVATADGKATVCFYPLLKVNLRWLIDLWLKRMGFSLDVRGSEFETYARNSIRDSATASGLAELTQICTTEFIFRPRDSREEEIDLLIVLGEKVLIGEAKCFLEPVSPVDRHNFLMKLKDAAEQVARKAAAIRTNTDEFRLRAADYRLQVPESFEVVPFVMLNNAIGAGRVIDQIPIVDLRIVEMFFEGELAWMSSVTTGGDIDSSEMQSFYASPAEAERTIAPYLLNPPQVQHLKPALRPRATIVPMFGPPESPTFRVHQEIDPAALSTPKGTRPPALLKT